MFDAVQQNLSRAATAEQVVAATTSGKIALLKFAWAKQDWLQELRHLMLASPGSTIDFHGYACSIQVLW